MKGFTKMSTEKMINTSGGNTSLILSSLLPLIFPMMTSVVSSFKLLFSDKGEIKNKDGTYAKWEKYEDKANNALKLHFIN